MQQNYIKSKLNVNSCTQNIPICLVPGPTGVTGPTGSIEPNPYDLFVQSVLHLMVTEVKKNHFKL